MGSHLAARGGGRFQNRIFKNDFGSWHKSTPPPPEFGSPGLSYRRSGGAGDACRAPPLRLHSFFTSWSSFTRCIFLKAQFNQSASLSRYLLFIYQGWFVLRWWGKGGLRWGNSAVKLITHTIQQLQKALLDKLLLAPPPSRHEITMYNSVTLGGAEQLPTETTPTSEPPGLRDAGRT